MSEQEQGPVEDHNQQEPTEEVQTSSSEDVQADTPSPDTGEEDNVADAQPKEPPKRQNVAIDQDPVKGDTHNKDLTEALSLLNVTPQELNELLALVPKLNFVASDRGRDWLDHLQSGIEHMLKGGVFEDSLSRDDSVWRQKVEIDGDQLGAGRPRLQAREGGQALSGEQALMRAQNLIGVGSVVQIPLWHTGIWVTLKAPADGALLELDRRIAQEKITLGRTTGGMIYSNHSVYITSYVVNFVLAHLYDATVRDTSLESLRHLIKATDIPTLVWGMACAIYPNGYPFSQPCTVDPSKCQHVTRTTLNLAKLSWTDNKALTQYQRRHMQDRSTKHSIETIKRYQDAHIRGNKEVRTITDYLKVTLEVPSVAQMEASGFAWVDGISRMVEDSFGVTLKGEERDKYILNQGRATVLRQYSHWVSQMELEDDYVEDRETVENLMGSFSAHEEISDKIHEGIGQYIDNSTLSLIGIPKYTCPACGGRVGDYDHEHPHILPLDMMTIFFTLRDQRIIKALSRASM